MAAILQFSIQALPLDITILLAGMALVLVILAAYGNKYKNLAGAVAAAGFGAGIILLVAAALGYFGSIPGYVFPEMLSTDWVSLLFGVAVLSASLLIALTASDYLGELPNVASFYSLLVFTTVGALLLTFASDLLMIFVAWELMSIPSYVLTGFKKKDAESSEAAVKYFIMSAFASAVLLYGISLVYLLTGSTNLYTIVTAAKGYDPIAVLALTFVLAGFGIKLAAVPFHMWIPDAYQGAPTIVSALLSAGTKGAVFAPAARVFFIVFAARTFQADWSVTFAVLAILSMTLGNFAALTQKHVTRILAYSSIGQAGYIMIGFAAGGVEGLTGSFFHILNYAIMQTAAFLSAALIIKQLGSDDLSKFDGVGRRLKVAPIAFTLSLLALGGFPPLNGFWSKFVLFYSAINANLGWLAIIAIINSFASIAFYVRIVKHMYVDGEPGLSKLTETRGFKVALVAASFVIVLIGIYPYPFIQFASTAASSFLHSTTTGFLHG
ncbi:MAG: NADH-quinone oxidoreductase subunit N [Thaumarchaeota archaeon]|nr:NADH-quinone oxidoreductase subunit N [Nitrososphaerota archaeon]MDG6908361.1 NADH-quinone oxidoreductase subunit N [Nitrososphaerota archaeon]